MARLFADMDGVVVDFEGYMLATGLTADEVKKTVGAYRAMKPMPGAIEAIRKLIQMGVDVWIATKPPTGQGHAYSEKAEWIFEHIPELKRKIIITHDKGLLGDKDDFLVDDRIHKANCESFAGTLIPFVNGIAWEDVISMVGSITSGVECHGLDTPQRAFFYEQEFYPFSNFSSFKINYQDIKFDTAEHLYHWHKFAGKPDIQERILNTASAHDAFSLAQELKSEQRSDWDLVKFDIMLSILRAKVSQHPYVLKKLLASASRELIENSWRDDVWGWGKNKDGQNLLGKAWMQVRSEVIATY